MPQAAWRPVPLGDRQGGSSGRPSCRIGRPRCLNPSGTVRWTPKHRTGQALRLGDDRFAARRSRSRPGARTNIAKIQDEGECWCGETVWPGRAAMRISVSSWATTDEDIERSRSAIMRAIETSPHSEGLGPGAISA